MTSYRERTHRPELEEDRVEGKHFAIAQRMLDRGGRQDIFLGTRDCQGYAEPCPYGSETGHYDGAGELGFGLMLHGFDYPDETGEDKLQARFWRPTMIDGRIRFDRPEECAVRKFVREMSAKRFGKGTNLNAVEAEAAEWVGRT